jgi:hypothetical protein
MSDAWVDLPTGRQLQQPKMSIRTLPRASAKAIARARSTWPESQADDFQPVGKLFVDRATGIAYRCVPGDPQAGGAGREDVSVWFISHDDEYGDGLVYLRRDGDPGEVVHSVVGEIGGRPALAHEAVAR